MPQMAPYNWTIYLTLTMIFLIIMITINFFNSMNHSTSKTSNTLKNTEFINWKW
uniref:ATP synthase complex subunit 8 n=1 Tax=Platypus contaminatus TaxID=2066526 RepID=A0A6C0RUR7_9CUCU|nr:ATP synthase F0 subunit 8 [Platypus contaminatus]QIA44531.1 ATP synthase F0 subunit 8 [Platypus contaminatus]